MAVKLAKNIKLYRIELSDIKRACYPTYEGQQALRLVRLAHLLDTIFSFTTSMRVSCLHLGQNRGNSIKTVSEYTFTLVFAWHTGQRTHIDSLLRLDI